MRALLILLAILSILSRVFGTQVVPTPPILKVLPKIFAHSDKTVRAEGSNLATILYQYIGPGIEPWLADLKPVQVKELKDSFDALEQECKGHKSLKPDRLTRAHAREVALQGEDDAPLVEEQGGSILLVRFTFIEVLLQRLPLPIRVLSPSLWISSQIYHPQCIPI
jgi:hypothetical protein